MMWCLLAVMAAPANDVEARVNASLAKLSLKEKIALIGGTGFSIRPMPSIGLPEIRMADGPVGVRNFGPTTAYPAGVALAATFNPPLAKKFGEGIARDAVARNVQIWLAPGVNLSRVPQNGRNFEYLGEDPLLAGDMAVQIVKGVQGGGVVATIKHYAANEHEADRNRDSSVVDERTMRELYLRPFERAVKEANVGAFMCSYNLINGTYASEHDWLQNQVLKKQWGFKGLIMSDWGATHHAERAALGGLDLEMPTGSFFNERNLMPLIESGKVPQSVIDEKVRRILHTVYAHNLDKPKPPASQVRDDPRNREIVLQTAREGIVLLKNDKSALPLKSVKNVLVVGPNGSRPVTGGGGSSYTTPVKALSVLDALKQLAPSGVAVDGQDDQSSFSGLARIGAGFRAPSGEEGLKVEYFRNLELTGEPAITAIGKPGFVVQEGRPIAGFPARNFSVRYTGKLLGSGRHLMMCRIDDGMRLWIDGKKVFDSWKDQGATQYMESIDLGPAAEHDLKIEYYQRAGEAVLQLAVVPESKLEQAFGDPAKIKAADVVVACVGFDSSTEGEGFDRPFELPPLQRMLLDQVAGHPRSIVVVNAGAGVDLSPWVDKVSAVVYAWYPGDVGNLALAEILFGKTNPSGKLPTTLPRKLAGTYYERAYPPKDNKIVYSEGLLMGYRWFDANRVRPLFAFGHGLSYTKFEIGGFRVQTGRGSTALRLTATVKNTGDSAGAEVVQFYAGLTGSILQRAKRQLAGYAKVNLRAGESKTVSVEVPWHVLASYNLATKRWEVEPGNWSVWVGNASDKLTSSASVKLSAKSWTP